MYVIEVANYGIYVIEASSVKEALELFELDWFKLNHDYSIKKAIASTKRKTNEN